MKFTSRKLLAAALLAAIPMSSAFACTTANWEAPANGGGSVNGNALAEDPLNGVERYSGECGLEGEAAGDFVTNNAPDAEGTYRARFYVFTGSTGDRTIFRATSADDNGGAEVIRVNYNPPNFSFSQNGGAAVNVPGIVANKWYSIEVLYVAGETFSATVEGNQGFSATTPAAVGGAGTIGSHSLGAISGGTGVTRVDAFESTRSADTEIGRLCRADSNASGGVSAADRGAITTELGGVTLATGQPDCNEDGRVTAGDRGCVTTLLATLPTNSCP